MIVAAGGLSSLQIGGEVVCFFPNPSGSRGRTDVAMPCVRM